MVSNDLDRILARAGGHEKLSREEILFLLKLRREEEVNALFEAARQLRFRHFGNKIFLYGFLYISTYCRNNCLFCFYRARNRDSLRYRKTEQEVLDAAICLAESGVHLIDLTMGEDPDYFHNGKWGFDRLLRLVESVKAASGLPIMVSPGVLPEKVLEELARLGATWYACYQETHCRSLFKKLRPAQSFDKRMNTKRLAHRFGLLNEEGVLAGVGEVPDDMVDSIEAMDSLAADQVRAMNFVPQKGTPMEIFFSNDPRRELVYIAVLRLVFPERLIPATLDVAGLAGLEDRLNAGANVVTSLVPPGQGLAGVAQSSLDIDDARRSYSSVISVLEKCSLKAASVGDYLSWIRNRQKMIRKNRFLEQVC